MKSKLARVFLALTPLLIAASAVAGTCLPDGTQSSGAVYRICMPTGTWNGDLVVYGHGYVAVNEPVGIPEDQLYLPDGTYLPDLITSLGYGFAMSSYSTNGLAIQQGVADSVDVVSVFSRLIATPRRTFITGPSEGGIVSALATERYPNVFAGGVAACGPIGNFPAQINYIGDFRVVFDYFFPGIIAGTATKVPQEVIDDWDKTYVPNILNAVHANPSRLSQLLAVTQAPGATSDEIDNTVESLLWYSVFTTNDASTKLGGQPFDNHSRIYHGSANDLQLNQGVARFNADPAAVSEMNSSYNTTGVLLRPLTTLHTKDDQIIPYWHENLYTIKNTASGTGKQRVNVPVDAYGHCNFTQDQVLLSFLITVLKATGEGIPNVEAALPPERRPAFRAMMLQYGIKP
jgi:pimeloyl-ACP methyl ester carboxylesterase